MKLNKAYITFLLAIVLLFVGCTKDISVKKVDINDVINNIKNKQEIVFDSIYFHSIYFDSIYNVNYIIKNPNEKNYKVTFSMELDNNENCGFGELYIYKEEFTNSDDILLTLNFYKNKDNKFVVSICRSIIRDKEVIGKSIITSGFNYFNNKDIYIKESDEVNYNMINNKVHISNITCKDTNQNAKIYLEIQESENIET